jgi:Ricin-type beta-trefoil lectin domain
MKFFISANTMFSFLLAVAAATGGTNAAAENNLRSMSSQQRREQVPEFEMRLFSMDENYCLNVEGASTENFTPLRIWECNGSKEQKFSFDASTGHLHSQLGDGTSCVEMDPEYGIFLYSPCVDSWEITGLQFGSEETVFAIKNVGDDQCLVMDGVDSHNGDAVMGGMCLEEDNYLQFGMVWKDIVLEEPFKPCC